MYTVPVTICNQHNCIGWDKTDLHIYCGFQPLPTDFNFKQPRLVLHNLHRDDHYRVMYQGVSICSSSLPTNLGCKLFDNEFIIEFGTYSINRLFNRVDPEYIRTHSGHYRAEIEKIFVLFKIVIDFDDMLVRIKQ